MALYGPRRRFTARVLCVLVVVFLGHFHFGCGQSCSRGPGASLSASGKVPHSLRHDPRTCPVYRALQSAWVSHATVTRAHAPLRVSDTIGLAVHIVVSGRTPLPTSARDPPLSSA